MRIHMLMIIVATGLTACHTSHVGPDACSRYMSWFEQTGNGMIQFKSSEKTNMTCLVTNDHYETIKSANADCRAVLKTIRSQNNPETQSLNFILKLTDRSGELKRSFSSRDYNKHEAPANFTLVYGHDTIRPVFYHFENHLEIAPVLSFIISFEVARKLQHDLVFSYSDQNLNLHESFIYPYTLINRIPKI